MQHTKLFRKFPCKFGINKNDDGSYFLFYKEDKSILDFMVSDPLYNVSNVGNIEDGYIVTFRYNNDETDDYSETVEFNVEDLQKKFSSISNILFIRRRLPHTRNQVTRCEHYSVYVENEGDCILIENYVFENFGYLKLNEDKINNQTVLWFTCYEEYCK